MEIINKIFILKKLGKQILFRLPAAGKSLILFHIRWRRNPFSVCYFLFSVKVWKAKISLTIGE
jgi:hypothetical protein